MRINRGAASDTEGAAEQRGKVQLLVLTSSTHGAYSRSTDSLSEEDVVE